MASAMSKLLAARKAARARLPYYGEVFARLTPVEAPGLGTWGVTEGFVLMHDPEATLRWSEPQCAFVFSHEVCHAVDNHAKRARRACKTKADFKDHNKASDYIINYALKKVWGFAPDDCLMPDRDNIPQEFWEGTTEALYLWLRDQRLAQPPPPSKPKGGEGDGDGKDEEDGDGKGDKKPCAGHCGSGAGRKLPNEPGKDHPASRTPAEIAAIAKGVARKIAEAARKNPGSVPLGLARIAEAALEEPKIPWEHELLHIIQASCGRVKGMVDLGFKGFSRKQLAVGLGERSPILPVWCAPEILVELVVDTSGSMGDKTLEKVVREAQGILRAAGSRLRVVSIDTVIHEDAYAMTPQQIAGMLKGGGGTDFCPYFKRLSERRSSERPNVVVFATDGWGPAPADPPRGVEIIWALIGKGTRKPMFHGTNEWGSFITIEE